MNAKDAVAKLDSLSSLIKRSAEIFEIAEISPDEVYGAIETLCDSAKRKIAEIVPVNIEAYERNFADWKIAWKDHKEILIAYCQEVFGEAAKKKKKEPAATYSKRLFYECQRAQVDDGWKDRLPTEEARTSQFVEDPTAHQMVKRWGGMSKEGFKADFQSTDRLLVQRAAAALGIKTSVTAKTFPEKLYKAAVRFANNTTLF